MKPNAKSIIGILAAFSVFALGACSKALEEKAFSFLSPNQFYKNEGDAKIAINAVYNELYTYDLFIQPFWNMTVLDDDHVTGVDWFLGTSGVGNTQGYWGWERPWAGCYVIIARANTVLENVEKITENIDAEMKTRILGEAYFLRGWAYLQLVQLYGGVPLRTQSLSVNPISNVPRATVMDTYAQVIEDFKKAETMLFPVGHEKAGEPGRATRGLAKAFLAKTYLTMASGGLAGVNVSVRGGQDNGYYTYQKKVVAGLEGIDSKAYYALARDKALEVIESKEYSLFTSWKELWSKDGRNKKEQMWEVQSLAGSPFINDMHNYFSALSTFGRGAVWVTNNHYIDYEDADKRVLDGVAHNYKTNTGTPYFYPSWQAAIYKNVGGVVYNNNGGTDDRAYVIKYSDVADPTVKESDAFFPLMRYSEVFLMYAEADNEASNGPTATSYQYLDSVRLRASATATPQNMTQEAFRSFVLAERGREFALEGIRRFDLIRWGIYLDVMNKITLAQNNISKVRAQRNLLMPIPLTEMNSNTTIKINNPGW